MAVSLILSYRDIGLPLSSIFWYTFCWIMNYLDKKDIELAYLAAFLVVTLSGCPLVVDKFVHSVCLLR